MAEYRFKCTKCQGITGSACILIIPDAEYRPDDPFKCPWEGASGTKGPEWAEDLT